MTARRQQTKVKKTPGRGATRSLIWDHLYYASITTLPKREEPAKELPTSGSLPAAIEALERRMIAGALHGSGGNKRKAAQAPGLSRQGLIMKLKRLDKLA